MTEKVTIELPENLVRRARAIAARDGRPVEEILAEWIDRAAADAAAEFLSDEELLELCDAQLAEDIQDELSALLERRGEGALAPAEQGRLEDLMQLYRRGLVRKAQALQAAVARGLKPQLS